MSTDDRIDPPALRIVIVSYKVRERLRACLDSLQNVHASTPAFEVVVVDNASGDGTVEQLSLEYPAVRFVANDRNLGFGMACNRGASGAAAPWILFLNPDTVVFPETLREVLAFAEARPRAGIVGCRILDGDGKLQLACRRSIPTPEVAFWRLTGLSFLFPRSRRFGRYNLTYLDPAESVPVEAVSGSFLLIRTEVFRDIEGFDERFFLYGEDLDLCLRTSRSGWEIWYCGGTSIVHHKGQSASTRPWGARMDFYKAMVVFARKNLGVGGGVGVILNAVASVLAVLDVSAKAFRQVRRWGFDLLVVNAVFFLTSTLYLAGVHVSWYLLLDKIGWIWHVILSAWFLAALGWVGEYRGWGSLPRRRHVALALALALGGFLATGFVLRSWVFSRLSFVLGGGLGSLAVFAVRMRFYRPAPRPMRTLVACDRSVADGVLRRMEGHARLRQLGRIAPSWETPQDPSVVTRVPGLLPALRAMEIDSVVVAAVDPRLGELIEELSQRLPPSVKLLLLLPTAAAGPPALVDITLDRSLIPELSQ